MEYSVSNLSVARGGRTILSGLNFGVSAGQALVLRGENGIGKTTLLRTLAGLQQPVSGDISGDRDAVAFASHADGVKAQLSVWENLSFWADLYGVEMRDEMLMHFDIADLRDRIAGTLSSGQKRRLGLARLAVLPSKILLLDEPTISLDAASVKLFAKFLTDTHLANGGAAIIATHIDLGLDADELDLTPFITKDDPNSSFDEAFL